jgi:hypothetical protein
MRALETHYRPLGHHAEVAKLGQNTGLEPAGFEREL